MTRVGQGFPRPGTKGVVITSDGIALREDVERATDRLTAPIYDPLDDPATEMLLGALQALPS